MNAPHTAADLGGRPGYGRVVAAADEELLHAGFDAKVLALTLAMGATGQWNIDQSRSMRERQPGYAHLSYYEIWLAALEGLLEERGLVSGAEVESGQALTAGPALARILRAADVPAVLARGGPTARVPTAAPRFTVGSAVRTITDVRARHTRLPGYARGRDGVVERVCGFHVFPDSNASGAGEAPQWLYTVVFAANELWPEAAALDRVSIDAWESYLELR